MRLWHRLLACMAGLAIAALLGYATWQWLSFDEGLSDYLDGLAMDQAETVAPRLAEVWLEDGGWSSLRQHPERFGGLVEVRQATGTSSRAARPPGTSPDPLSAPGLPPGPPPGPTPGDRSAGMPEFPEGPPPSAEGPGGPSPDPEDRRRSPGPPSAYDSIGRRLQLTDVDGVHVAGSRAADVLAGSVPVIAAGRTVGILNVASLPPLQDSSADLFARAQLRSALVAAAMVLLLATVLAWVLSRGLLRPVSELAASTRALASGDWSRRVPDDRRDEFGELARDFNHMAGRLQANHEARTRWGQDIAHELRTPITVLRAELQVLLDGIRPLDPDALGSLLAEVDRLDRLVEDLRTLSLAQDAELGDTFGPVELTGLLDDSITRHLDPGSTELQVDWEPPAGEIHVWGDASRLTQLIDNLLINSVRYTDVPGRARIRLGASENEVSVRVEDSGPGVADEDLERIFDRLYRADRSRSRQSGGSGLGLAISRAIAEAHNGSIVAAHSRLGGLALRVSLPRYTPDRD